MAINVTDIMALIGERLGVFDELNVYDYPTKSAETPFAFLDFPESIQYDQTFGRGADRMSVRLFVCVSNNDEEYVRTQLAAYAAGDDSGVKYAVEHDDDEPDYSMRVESVEFAGTVLAGNTYAAAVFTIDVAA